MMKNFVKIDKKMKRKIVGLDEDVFLSRNKDVTNLIENGIYENISTYFESIGLDEIEQGLRKFHESFVVYNEEEYLSVSPDVKNAIEKGMFKSAFEHFCRHGYEEIISGNRKWKLNNDVNGHIDLVDCDKIIGWAGSESLNELHVSFFINKEHIGNIIPKKEREDLKKNVKFVNASGFEFIFDINILLKQFEVTKEVNIQMEIDGHLLSRGYSVKKDIWFDTINNTFNKNSFLKFIPLFNARVEKALSLNNIIDALTFFDDYELSKSLPKVRSNIIKELNNRTINDKDEHEKLYNLLLEHHDILLEVSKGLYKIFNIDLLSLVNKVINIINHHDAKEIINNAVGSRDNIFDVEKMNKKIENDELLFSLSNNPKKIIETWKGFDIKERLENAFSFINLFVFLQEFDAISSLELSFKELYKLVQDSEDKTGIELQKSLFSKGNDWEAMLITVYLVSSGMKKRQWFEIVDSLVDNLSKFQFVNTPVLKWIIDDSLLNSLEIDSDEKNTLMKKIISVIDEKDLWGDALVKKLYLRFVNRLASTEDILFDEIYKLGLEHFLLDIDFFIEENVLTQQYFDIEYLTWIHSIESLRKNIIHLLTNMSQSHVLLQQLDLIEYLSPKIVSKIKFDLHSNIINIAQGEKVEKSTYELIKTGGIYDKLMASSKLGNDNLQMQYESKLINNTTKWQSKGKNNYWYREALSHRSSPEFDRINFLGELYMMIVTMRKGTKEISRLIRLFFSELLWNVESGLSLDRLKIRGVLLDDIVNILIRKDEKADEYRRLFDLYLILNGDAEFDKKYTLNDLISDVREFETRDKLKERLKDILKMTEIEEIDTHKAKKHLKEVILYPYTLVMVYSCKAYIKTRQKVIRETWYKRAKELGIDCIFVVGDSDVSKLEKDMLYLAVEDTYERLPQKSIEMFRFAFEQFSYDRFMKIDDDCFLNLDAYFSDDILFDTDYYGRMTYRAMGGTNRIWHQKKSKSIDAKNAIDLSPEPSWYADGSTGYTLSRQACEELIKANNDSSNTFLVNSSFMEDKLVGDLLGSRGIRVDSTNFASIVYRKVTEFHDVTFWEYNVAPKQDNNVKILHCEMEKTLRKTWEQFFTRNDIFLHQRYFSNKPANDFTSFGYDEQAFIEGINVQYSKIANANHIGIIVCKNELSHLLKLLEHHRLIGITHFIYIDNGSDDGSLEFMSEQDDVSIFVTTQLYKNSRFGVNWIEAALVNFCIGKWILVIDADEFFIYDNFEQSSIKSLTEYAENNGYDSFLAPMIDMYNKGSLEEAKLGDNMPYVVCNYFDDISSMSVQEKETYGPFSNSVVYSGGLRARVFGRYNAAPTYSYLNQKYCLFKYNPTHTFIEGIHFMGNNNPSPIRAALLHFKYHAEFYDKVNEQILNGQHWNGSQEYKRYFSKLEHNENLSLYDEKISIKYENSSSLIKAGYMDKLN